MGLSSYLLPQSSFSSMDDDRAKSEPNNPCPDSHHNEPADFPIPWEELKRLENWDGDPDAMELGLPTRSGRLDDIESRYCRRCMAALGYKPTGKYFAYFQKIFHEPCTCDHDHLRPWKLLDCAERTDLRFHLGDVDDILAPNSASLMSRSGDSKRISPSDRYVALSYVWGRVVDETRLMTRTSNFDQLHEKDSLRRLPLTVEDALKICESIGENHLWVDSICIAQDDESRKGGQIAMMDQIYASASLVLVIASCEGMHEQIRRVSVDRKIPVCERVEDLVFMEAREISAAYLYTMVWSTRGWTYQERALARRKLILLNQEVIFSCSTRALREYTYQNDDLQAKGDMHNQSWRLLQMEDDSSDLWTQYVGHVERYTKRSLGDGKDKLNVISGILRPLFNDHGGCLFGIPLSYLDLGLLWSCTNSSTMEKQDSASVESSITSGFPTWSWTSVKSSVTYDMVGLRADTFAGSLVKWFYQPAPGSRLEPIPSQRPQVQVGRTNSPRGNLCRLASATWHSHGVRGCWKSRIQTDPRANFQILIRSKPEHRSSGPTG